MLRWVSRRSSKHAVGQPKKVGVLDEAVFEQGVAGRDVVEQNVD
jgi:hypothetical protein